MDLVTLALAKKFAMKVAAGFHSVVANNEDHSITFTMNDGSTAKLVIPVPDDSLRDVHLYCDGGDIYMFNDKTTPLTFTEIKALIADERNSVHISNDYYSIYNKYHFVPSITSQEKEAIGFIGETQLNGVSYSWRIIINEDNVVKGDEIPHETIFNKVKTMDNPNDTTYPTTAAVADYVTGFIKAVDGENEFTITIG